MTAEATTNYPTNTSATINGNDAIDQSLSHNNNNIDINTINKLAADLSQTIVDKAIIDDSRGTINPAFEHDFTHSDNSTDNVSESEPLSTATKGDDDRNSLEREEGDDTLTEIVVTHLIQRPSMYNVSLDSTSSRKLDGSKRSLQFAEPMRDDDDIDIFTDKVKHFGLPIEAPAGGLPGRRKSIARRASVSINQMRRKSMDAARHVTNTYRGIILAMISSVFFTLTAAIVKYLKDVHPGQTAVFRFLGILLFTIPLVIQSGEHPLGPQGKRHFLILRGIAGASSLYLRYSALHMLPIANATIIVLSMPVFVCIFARVFLKEPCGIFHVVAIGVTLLGIGFTSKINVLVGISDSFGVDKEKEMWGLFYSMAATLVGSAAYILVRKVKEVHSSVILLNFSVVAIIETSAITAMLHGFKMQDCGLAPWFLIFLAVLSFYAQLLLTKALQMEEASIVSVTRSSSEVVCAFIFQIVFFHSMPEWNAVVGAILVSSSVLLTRRTRGPLGQTISLVHNQIK